MKIHPSQLEHLISKTPQALIGHAMMAPIIIALLLKMGFPAQTIVNWAACIVLLLSQRYLIYQQLLPSQNLKNKRIRNWFVMYVVNVFILSALWSFLFFQIIQRYPPELHFLSMAIVFGFAGAGIVTLSSIFIVYTLFILPLFAPLIMTFLLQESYLHKAGALFLLMGFAYSLYAAYWYSYNLRLAVENNERLQESEIEALVCLGKAGEYRDSDTGNHVLRVGYSCYLLAKSIGLSEKEAKTLKYASPLHDLGKIGIPDRILLKPEKLTTDEFQIMKRHTQIGAEILKNSKSEVIQMAKAVALSHHEKWDGSGYPYGLSGDNIPIVGRIVAICDVFDALISPRPYKTPWSSNEAIDFLRKNAGTHFDPRLVDLFIQNIPKLRVFSDSLESYESATGIHPLTQLG